MDSYNAKNSSNGSLNGCEAVRIMEHYLKEPNPSSINLATPPYPILPQVISPFPLSV